MGIRFFDGGPAFCVTCSSKSCERYILTAYMRARDFGLIILHSCSCIIESASTILNMVFKALTKTNIIPERLFNFQEMEVRMREGGAGKPSLPLFS